MIVLFNAGNDETVAGVEFPSPLNRFRIVKVVGEILARAINFLTVA